MAKHPPRKLIPVPSLRRSWYQMPNVIAGLTALGLILALAIIVPAYGGCSTFEMNPQARLQPPSTEHWLGTDQFGRDTLCRTMYGGRISVPTGMVSVLTAVLPGLILGLLAGYFGGWWDTVIGYVTDVMLAFPSILMALLIIAWLGPSLSSAMLAVGFAGIPRYVRMARSSSAQLKRAWFIRAARIVGCTEARILTRHILPNVLPTILALATLDVAWAILNAAALSFVGLGAQPPLPEWGAMINEGRSFLRQAPWMALAPGAMITSTVLAIHLLGDGLRDVLDPRVK
jgi:peptide/nickel transport system permease protein